MQESHCVLSVCVLDLTALRNPSGDAYSWYEGLLIPHRRSDDDRFRLQYLRSCAQADIAAQSSVHLLVLGTENVPPHDTLNYARVLRQSDSTEAIRPCAIEGLLDFPLNLTIGGELSGQLIPYASLWVHESDPQSSAAMTLEVSSDHGLSYLEIEAGRGPELPLFS